MTSRTLLIALLPLVASAADEVEFRFSPPLNKPYTETQVATRVMSMGTMKRTEVRTTKVQMTYSRKPGGYLGVAKVISAEVVRDGTPLADPMLDVLKQVTITYELNEKGVATDVKGLEDLQKRMLEKLPPDAAQKMAAMVSVDAMKKKELAEFNARTGALAGTKLKVGEGRPAEEDFPTPTGETAKLKGTTTLVGKVACGKEQCAHLRTVTESEVPMGKLLEEANKGAKGNVKLDPKTAPRVKNTVERVVNPATLMPHSEKQVRTVTITMSTPQGPMTTEVTETKEYTYAY
ncbi:MAG: hypothetical protein AB2A00_15440 [Myxococcota bacterium]